MMLKHLAKLFIQDHSVVRTTVYHRQCYSVLCTMSHSQIKNRQRHHMPEEASNRKDQFSTSALSFFHRRTTGLCFSCVVLVACVLNLLVQSISDAYFNYSTYYNDLHPVTSNDFLT